MSKYNDEQQQAVNAVQKPQTASASADAVVDDVSAKPEIGGSEAIDGALNCSISLLDGKSGIKPEKKGRKSLWAFGKKSTEKKEMDAEKKPGMLKKAFQTIKKKKGKKSGKMPSVATSGPNQSDDMLATNTMESFNKIIEELAAAQSMQMLDDVEFDFGDSVALGGESAGGINNLESSGEARNFLVVAVITVALVAAGVYYNVI